MAMGAAYVFAAELKNNMNIQAALEKYEFAISIFKWNKKHHKS